MGARQLYEEQIMQLVHQAPEEKLPGILAQLKRETEPTSPKKTKEEILEGLNRAQEMAKGQFSSVENFMKWKNEERALEKSKEKW